EARETMLKVLEGLATQPVTADEVEQARQRFKSYRDRLAANSQRIALELSEWAGAGDWKLFFLHRDRMEKVTAADVNKAAARYLVRANRTVGVYAPTKAAERAEVPTTPDVASLLKGYKGREAVAA